MMATLFSLWAMPRLQTPLRAWVLTLQVLFSMTTMEGIYPSGQETDGSEAWLWIL